MSEETPTNDPTRAAEAEPAVAEAGGPAAADPRAEETAAFAPASDAAASEEPAAAGEGESSVAVDEVEQAAATASEAEPVAQPAPVVAEPASDEGEAPGSEPVDEEPDEDDEDEPTLAVAPMGPIEELTEEELEEEINLDWYILKVQSNRERTSSEALKRKVAIEGIDRYFGEIIVPTEKVTEFKNGKKKTVSRKIWPGYIAVQMHVNDDTWFAIRETSGIGDFTGASGKPIPMSPADVEKILPKEEGEESEEDTPKLNIKFAEGDKVKVTDGNFENFEGDVDSIDQQSGKITVMISIFGRSTPVELEYWQVEKL